MGLMDDLDGMNSSQKAGSSWSQSGMRRKEASTAPPSSQLPDREGEATFHTWSLSQLQAEAKKYGFRPTQSRKALLDQLQQVQQALEKRNREEVGDVSVASSSSSFLHSAMDSSGILAGEEEEDETEDRSMGDLSRNIVTQARDARSSRSASDDEANEGEKSSIASSSGENEEEEDEVHLERHLALREEMASSTATSSSPSTIAPSLSDQLYNAVTSDSSLYHRILLFEPVSFDEVSSTAKRAGVTGLRNKEILRNWLDMQGICFYSAELTGQRQRY